MKDTQSFAHNEIASLYEWFVAETAQSSPTWARLCAWIAQTPRLLERLDRLPGSKRQPNLFLGAIRFHGGPTDPGPQFLDWVEHNWQQIEATILERRTQTNEPGRCATLVPLIAGLGERIALIEVGMSAGLCLFPDLYGYEWQFPDRQRVTAGDSSVTTMRCAVNEPGPGRYQLPNVVWRAGIDLNPLDPADPDDARWLTSLVWPGESSREERLRACLSATAGHDLLRVRGDATEELAALVDRAPADATVVVFHTAVLAYFEREARTEFEDLVRSLPVRWVSNEGRQVVRSVRQRLSDAIIDDPEPSFILSLDAEPMAVVAPHGQRIQWIS